MDGTKEKDYLVWQKKNIAAFFKNAETNLTQTATLLPRAGQLVWAIKEKVMVVVVPGLARMS